ncbi:MAG TPA: hypothetical protein VFA11_00970 [Acidimicrobiales bacterium]|nr:hypothetical protein [Acidimicrobiales bacterium]
MGDGLNKALVLTILRHAEDFPWRMHDIGLMALRLDEQRQYRLHVWDPTLSVGEPPIHDHPYDFTSEIVAGELTNTLYHEDRAGEDYVRFRYPPGAEDLRRSDTVRLSATAATFTEGDHYRQRAQQLHASWQLPGTVTAIRCSWVEVPALTVCLREEGSWRSAQTRDARRQEVKAMAARALEWF